MPPLGGVWSIKIVAGVVGVPGAVVATWVCRRRFQGSLVGIVSVVIIAWVWRPGCHARSLPKPAA